MQFASQFIRLITVFTYFLDDSYVSRNNGIKITPTARKSGSKMLIAQSLPMAVPIFNQHNDDDYEEVRLN